MTEPESNQRLLSEEEQKKKRITYQLHTLWDSLKEEKEFPALEDIHPEDVGEIWQDCFIVEVIDGGVEPEFKEIYLGPSIRDMYSDLADETIQSVKDKLMALYVEVIRERRPVLADFEFMTINNDEIRYRQILLPIGRDGHAVDHIMGGMRYKLFEKH